MGETVFSNLLLGTSSWSTKDWVVPDEKVLVDARDDMMKDLLDRDIQDYVFFNNHFAGHAPDSLRQFSQMLTLM